MIYTLRVISILLVAMAMIPAGAHLFSMGSKLQLGGAAYLVSQRAYDGWNMFAFVIVGTLISTLSLTVASYHAGEPFTLPGVSFLCLVAAQTLFWTLTFPANRRPPIGLPCRMDGRCCAVNGSILTPQALS